MKIIDYMKTNPVYLDGGTGTLVQKLGLKAGEVPESWNLTHRGEIVSLHKEYYDAGSNVVVTNTFGVNGLKYTEEEIDRLVTAAVEIVRQAKTESTGKQKKYIALDIGPLGRLLKPLGGLDFDDAVRAFAPVVRKGLEAGVDLVFIETMNDCYETKAALLAVKENCDLPVFVCNAYGEDGRLMSGATPEVMVPMLESMGADAIGVNCSLGPNALLPVMEDYLKYASVPLICKPNAGLPRVEDGRTVFDVGPEEFSLQMQRIAQQGVGILGGCCGTTPAHIRELVLRTKDLTVTVPEKKTRTVITSGTKAVDFDTVPVLIGERINPTGKKLLKQALAEKNIDYILEEGLKQQDCGAMVLDVNVGAPDIEEKTMLPLVMEKLQAVCDLPLQLDTSDAVAMEKALRRYNGKPLVNSVSGKKESMEAIFPLVKKYGGAVIALTLDENGIPDTAEGRIRIAEKIVETAGKYGIGKKDILFDPLTLTVSADGKAAAVTLEALRKIRFGLGCHTSLGVSNVSFGLPGRAGVNSVFFAMALENGLSAAIMNPFSKEMMNTFYAWRTLRERDANCMDYIRFAEANAPENSAVAPVIAKASPVVTLKEAVKKGLKEQAAKKTQEMLQDFSQPLEIVQKEIIPALNEVGTDFETKKAFLPQLLMSAEAAGSAFEVIKASMAGKGSEKTGCKILLATVKGDIHDIGKNIVRLLLENYGFEVIDLGRDVPPEKIVEETVRQQIPIVGLSALMTTTVPSMEETIRLLREKAPFARIVVGGAVLTESYAKKIGADYYAETAMDTVRYAQNVQLGRTE